MAVIYLAGGCFWGMQGYFDRLKGVLDSSVGYANSKIANPSYDLVCSGASGAVETLKLEYDESALSLREIIERFLSIIDPCALNYQGNDRGTQYRNGVYYEDSQSESVIRECLKKWEQGQNRKAVTEILPLANFYEAESYHQKYLEKNPNGYCHIDIESALHSFQGFDK
ncbi:peptide methionine sulfoxide reductase MrsA [Helicobacter cinaedi PAGU611]|uniref:peptide-methionine (S)-S-oxide reductase MsrA n=1 Tax=Helicobacter cinaedi TaxID=213 RepID=UPI00025D33BD|nr:peptide-methionine (S)-S-oxide reductase MsrA [Helicobacter cinaedi]AWK62270.1 peptide-methionine (S)-S-oxide reductase [Helicobacter cinaedi]QOQ97088.1 peptide-methionine (S)-S-oxide reductase MsrA [Helicobacter cinaedi]BAM12837.1 peptide methionine sulfoxide reductase MrsA [Helicobacter cinaedi PAGU611]BBB20695.1 peptide methionine sulfoxide reductase MsrA [Helicobacter cinaedi]